MMDRLANACVAINNANRLRKRTVLIRGTSKVVKEFLETMQKYNYISSLVYIDDHRQGKALVGLNGRLNKCGAVCPRYDVTMKEIERYRESILPARQFGHLIFTTSKGILDHNQCLSQRTGGKIIGFFY
ncbi:40S ribosomal protein S22-B [Dictyocoela muelleri]|nr:40S ribosomal protein S22-B [Dictyocoela muelleri]